MKKKTGFLILIVFIIILSLYYVTKKKDVTVYLGIANSSVDSIPVYLSFDTLVLFNDCLHNNPWKYEIFKVSLRPGVYPLVVSSSYLQTNKKANLFVLLNQHIVIEFYENSERLKGKSSFHVRNRLTSFYLE